MIEPIMYLGLGFLVASLIALITVPFVHSRAVRLTTRRLEAGAPLSMAEIQADKDQLRAEFAMSTRRLELSVEEMKKKTTGQLADLGKKTEAIGKMKVELGEKTATILALEAREKALKDQLRATEDDLATKTSTLHQTERTLADKEAELIRLTADLDQQSSTSDSQRIEIVALSTQVDALRGHVSELDHEVKNTEGRLARERTDAEAASKKLNEERGHVEQLGSRVSQLERQLAAQTTEAEILGRRVADLELRLSDQGRTLVERERERDQLRRDLEATQRVEAELRQELTLLDRRFGTTSETLKAQKVLAEAQLERMREDRAKLQRELAAMKREAETTWAAERVENALLRERINDIAAEVAHVTAVLEGPDSPIESILNQDAARTARLAAGNGTETKPGGEQKGSLADRIRALQSRASRLPTATS